MKTWLIVLALMLASITAVNAASMGGDVQGIGLSTIPTQQWTGMGGYITSTPDTFLNFPDPTSPSVNGTAVPVVRGGDGAVRLKEQGTWVGRGGYIQGDPIAVEGVDPVTKQKRELVFAIGGDNALWQLDAVTGSWTPLGGYINGNIAFSNNNVFVRGGDGGLWTKNISLGSNAAWVGLGGYLLPDGKIRSYFDPIGVHETLVTGGDHNPWLNSYWTKNGQGWFRWTLLDDTHLASPMSNMIPSEPDMGGDAVTVAALTSTTTMETMSWNIHDMFNGTTAVKRNSVIIPGTVFNTNIPPTIWQDNSGQHVAGINTIGNVVIENQRHFNSQIVAQNIGGYCLNINEKANMIFVTGGEDNSLWTNGPQEMLTASGSASASYESGASAGSYPTLTTHSISPSETTWSSKEFATQGTQSQSLSSGIFLPYTYPYSASWDVYFVNSYYAPIFGFPYKGFNYWMGLPEDWMWQASTKGNYPMTVYTGPTSGNPDTMHHMYWFDGSGSGWAATMPNPW